jgi:hypothetical protein
MSALCFQFRNYNYRNTYFMFIKSKQGTRIRKQDASIQNIRALLSVRFGHELTPDFQIYPWEGSELPDKSDHIAVVDSLWSDTPCSRVASGCISEQLLGQASLAIY